MTVTLTLTTSEENYDRDNVDHRTLRTSGLEATNQTREKAFGIVPRTRKWSPVRYSTNELGKNSPSGRPHVAAQNCVLWEKPTSTSVSCGAPPMRHFVGP
jgi:hypothetical protein